MKRYVGKREQITRERWVSHYGWSEEEAQEMATWGQTECRVYVEEVDDDGEVTRHELEHHVYHSPAGFNWSYHGSGPAELARCLLIDYLGGLDALPRNAFDEPVVPLYQEFKRQFIATASEPGFVIEDVEIQAWFALQEAAATIKDESAEQDAS